MLRYLVCLFFGEQWREPPKDALDKMVLTTIDLGECEDYKQVCFVSCCRLHHTLRQHITSLEPGKFYHTSQNKIVPVGAHHMLRILARPVVARCLWLSTIVRYHAVYSARK